MKLFNERKNSKLQKNDKSKQINITNTCFYPFLFFLPLADIVAVFCLLLQIHFSTLSYPTLCFGKMTILDHTNKFLCPHNLHSAKRRYQAEDKKYRPRVRSGSSRITRLDEGHCSSQVPSLYNQPLPVALPVPSPYSFSSKSNNGFSSTPGPCILPLGPLNLVYTFCNEFFY